MPTLIRSQADHEFALKFVQEYRDELPCGQCRPDTWNPDEDRINECPQPLLPLIGTHKHGTTKEVLWEQCPTYRDWALAYAERKKAHRREKNGQRR